MATFEQSIPVILAHEGGFSDDPADRGGITNWGISLAFARQNGLDIDKDGDVDAEDIRKLTKAQAIEIYRDLFWNKGGYGNLTDQKVATKVFDCAVNMGHKRAAILAQQAANTMGKNLLVDGSLGPKSFAAINSLHPTGFVAEMSRQMKAFYLAIITKNPSQKVFEKGWLKRAAWGT